MRKRSHWIVFTRHSPVRSLKKEDDKFYYLSCSATDEMYWTADINQAHRFTRPQALKVADCRGAEIDFHPDFRYVE